MLILQIASDTVLNQAYEWLCDKRRDYSHNNDVWELRCNWDILKPNLQIRLITGEYEFCPLDEIRLPDSIIELWRSEDALVLKAVSIVLKEHLKPVLSPRCVHIEGNGGRTRAIKETIADLYDNDKPNKFVMRSDIKSYYASIDHYVLYDLFCRHVEDKAVRSLVWQYLQRTVCFGENYRDITRGISLGCPLSPLMAGLYLKPLDDAVETLDVFYCRFMDDWVIVADTRWKLKKAVAVVNKVLNELKVEKHPDKTFIGRFCKGFDFLGYRFEPKEIKVAQSSADRFWEHIARLYEQGADDFRVGQYVRKWWAWAMSGVKGLLMTDNNWSVKFNYIPFPSITLPLVV